MLTWSELECFFVHHNHLRLLFELLGIISMKSWKDVNFEDCPCRLSDRSCDKPLREFVVECKINSSLRHETGEYIVGRWCGVCHFIGAGGTTAAISSVESTLKNKDGTPNIKDGIDVTNEDVNNIKDGIDEVKEGQMNTVEEIKNLATGVNWVGSFVVAHCECIQRVPKSRGDVSLLSVFFLVVMSPSSVAKKDLTNPKNWHNVSVQPVKPRLVI